MCWPKLGAVVLYKSRIIWFDRCSLYYENFPLFLQWKLDGRSSFRIADCAYFHPGCAYYHHSSKNVCFFFWNCDKMLVVAAARNFCSLIIGILLYLSTMNCIVELRTWHHITDCRQTLIQTSGRKTF